VNRRGDSKKVENEVEGGVCPKSEKIKEKLNFLLNRSEKSVKM